jgi:hypothetical protein
MLNYLLAQSASSAWMKASQAFSVSNAITLRTATVLINGAKVFALFVHTHINLYLTMPHLLLLANDCSIKININSIALNVFRLKVRGSV